MVTMPSKKSYGGMPTSKLPLKKRILVKQDEEVMMKALVDVLNKELANRTANQAFTQKPSPQTKYTNARKAAKAVGAAQRERLAEERKKMTRLEREIASFNPHPKNRM